MPGASLPLIQVADGAADMAITRELFTEYASSLGFSLCFQGFDEELRTLPGKYAPPRGALLLARCDGEPVGCVALRPIDATTAELKRLYVRPDARGRGLGRALTEAAIAAARAMGYAAIRLDTLKSMVEANRLYDALGFREIAAYCDNPHDTARFLELSANRPDARGG
ncbi:MAG: GNAT family N-acetyltransferase [Phycisphaerae bacterium]